MSGRLLFRHVRTLLSAASAVARTGVCPEELLARARGPSRRAVLRGAGVAAAALPLVGCRREGFASNPGRARVIVVGGGLAGLAALHRLAQGGIYAELYEALDYVGGRALSVEGLFYGGTEIITELGGQFVDSWHTETLDLASELGIDLLDRSLDAGLERVFYINGARRSESELVELLVPVASAVDACYDVIQDDGELISYEEASGATAYDNESLSAFLENTDADSVIKSVIGAAYLSEYGLDLGEQSALNLILMLGTDPGTLDLYGGSDERYLISGGSQRLATGLAERYDDRLHLGRGLDALVENHDGTYTLTLSDGSTVDADVVVMTLPFSVLRRLDLQITMSDVKRQCINELGYGTNSKVLLPFATRFWREGGESGELYTDLDIQSGWDDTQLQAGTQGVMTLHVGGAAGLALGTGTIASHASASLSDLEQIWPGCSSGAGQDPFIMAWPMVPTALGSYACYRVGQYTTIGGAEGEPAGNVYFAGEHCSYDCQGYLNGAVQSGQSAADDVIALLGAGRGRRAARATRRFPRPGGLLGR